MRETNEKEAPAIVKIVKKAFSDEIALGTLPTKQLIEFSKSSTEQILVHANDESAFAGFITMQKKVQNIGHKRIS